jgi:uncharacterized Zn-binding protein involved in type VI secretion
MVTGQIPHVGGPILPACAVTVLTCAMPQARVGDKLFCIGPPDTIVKGSATVMVNRMPAARLGDLTAHGGVIVIGAPTVIIGDAGSRGGGGAAPGLTSSGAYSAPAAQAKALVMAAKGGTPFCERCQRSGGA